MTTETLERLKRAASAKPNGNASNVRAADLSALIAENEALNETLKAIRAVNVNEFGYVADDAIDRLIASHGANIPAQQRAH